ncbi:MAG: TRAP transporter small permease [Geminicoccaceae bacterium]
MRGLAARAATILGVCAGMILFLLMVLTCVDVIGRYLFSAPLEGATELTELLMGGMIFAAMPWVATRNDHVTVDLMDGVFPHNLTSWRDRLVDLICAVALFVIGWRVVILAARSRDYGDRTPYLEIPLYPVSYFIAAMCAVAAVLTLMRALAPHRSDEPAATGDGPDSR